MIRRDISSISVGMEFISVFMSAQASSTRSMALSGKGNLSLIYLSESVAAAMSALSCIFTPWYTS